MEVEVFTLCRSARTDPNGGLYIAGVVENVSAPMLPVMAPPIYAAVRIRIEPREAGQHTLRFRFADEDGRQLFTPLDMPINATVNAGHPYGWIYAVQGFVQLPFDRFAVFGCHLEVDGQELAWVPFAIVRS